MPPEDFQSQGKRVSSLQKYLKDVALFQGQAVHPGTSANPLQAKVILFGKPHSATKKVEVGGSEHCAWLDFTDKEGGSHHMGEVR